MNNIYFTSDPHAYHKNICRGTSDWDDRKTRDYNNPEEMTQDIIQKWNSIVKYDDVLYCLGDWAFAGHENIKKFRDQLHCRTIHLIFGNHCQNIEPINSPYRELFASCDYYKTLSLKVDKKWNQVGKVKIIMSHYAMRVWDGSHRGSIQLYGHSHGSLADLGNRQMDVGVDTNNMYPYHLDEILDKMLSRPIHIIDHHNEKTN